MQWMRDKPIKNVELLLISGGFHNNNRLQVNIQKIADSDSKFDANKKQDLNRHSFPLLFPSFPQLSRLKLMEIFVLNSSRQNFNENYDLTELTNLDHFIYEN